MRCYHGREDARAALQAGAGVRDSYVGKKQRHLKPEDDKARVGDQWTFVAIDSDTKLIPSYLVGKRTAVCANIFMRDLSMRLANRIQHCPPDATRALNFPCYGFGTSISAEGHTVLGFPLSSNHFPVMIHVPQEKLLEVASRHCKMGTPAARQGVTRFAIANNPPAGPIGHASGPPIATARPGDTILEGIGGDRRAIMSEAIYPYRRRQRGTRSR